MSVPGELELEIAGRDLAGPAVDGRPGRAMRGWLLGLPCLLLVGAVLVAPVVHTVAVSLGGPPLGNYAALLRDGETRAAVYGSLSWVLVAVGVCVVGFALAVLSRRVRFGAGLLILVLVAPTAVSMLVSGIAFRMLYDPSHERGAVSALVVAAHDAVTDPAPAAGARPDLSVGSRTALEARPPADGLVTEQTFVAGAVVDLAVLGVLVDVVDLRDPAPQPGTEPGVLSGRVMFGDRALSGVPVVATSLGAPEGTATTDGGGVFRIPVRSSSASTYRLQLPEEAISPRWSPPDWLGPAWVHVVIASAFVWAWVGFAAALFRVGLDAIPRDLLRMARSEGVGRWRQLRTVVLPLLRPVTAVVLLTVVVAAVRLFDLVLVMVPGSVQANADVVALNWWREGPFRTEGESAALSVLLFAVVAVVALFGMRGLRSSWPRLAPPATSPPATPRTTTGYGPWWGVALTAGVALLWAYPLLSLLLTSVRDPRDAAVAGWWAPGRAGPGVESYAEVLGNGLASALGSTTLVAITATALVLLVAVPAAYQLAWGELPPLLTRSLVVLLTLLAVVPVQVYAEPLNAVITQFGLANSRVPLILVHTAAGTPFAVLLLRAAFATAPSGLVAGARLGEVGRRTVFDRVLRHAAPALVAVAVLEFVQVWNDFTLGLLVNGAGAGPLSLALWGQARQFATSSGPLAAGAVLSAVVPVVLFLLTWRVVVRGLTGGGGR
ncbi:ABC transporter permease subunit [Umezawaea beigongshangensis]|uniref:ABC transporter permease subunit n=1 Tax=Umezawaea beigongshangensis TaxID=2780383 RepID=UPI0018F1F071|nr:ABC transporter permease subunit [Umezawaea beigongshangensis]